MNEEQDAERELRTAIELLEDFDPEYATKVVDILAELDIGSGIEIEQLLNGTKCEFQEGEKNEKEDFSSSYSRIDWAICRWMHFISTGSKYAR